MCSHPFLNGFLATYRRRLVVPDSPPVLDEKAENLKWWFPQNSRKERGKRDSWCSFFASVWGVLTLTKVEGKIQDTFDIFAEIISSARLSVFLAPERFS